MGKEERISQLLKMVDEGYSGNPDSLSFIVVMTFGFGIGTSKTDSSSAIKELRQHKCFLDKCSKKNVTLIIESEGGVTEHSYTFRINMEGLMRLLFHHVYPEECCTTAGSLSLEYGLCDAFNFSSCIQKTYRRVDTMLTISKLYKQLTGQSYSGCEQLPYCLQVAEGMAGFVECSAYITPVKSKDGDWELDESVMSFFDLLGSADCTDFESYMSDYFGCYKYVGE